MTETSLSAVDTAIIRATEAAMAWASSAPASRARALAAVADALDAAADELVPIALAESHLSEARLRGELTRTTFQLRLLGREVTRGAVLDARIDQADPDWPMGAPRPDLRRAGFPVGPVVVFAASNFPFAFSVAGGDSASALAAGCPVIVKAHPGHPELSRATGNIVVAALTAAGAPAGVFTVVEGFEAGIHALSHPAVRAGAFTGSIAGGRALFDLASARPEPIPFYAEMGSVNPVFVTAEAAEADQSILEGFIASFALGAGQFCTKPGLLIVPRSAGLARELASMPLGVAAEMLNEQIASGYSNSLARLAADPAVEVLGGVVERTHPLATAPTLLRTDIAAVLDNPALAEECFGPSSLVVEYDEPAQMVGLASVLPGQLTATIWGTDDSDVDDLVAVLIERAGRLLWNQWPTGVSVTYAQQHGGPYPATSAPGTTSVGTAAVSRFLRPVAFQNFPDRMLPASLRDGNPWAIPQRRSDGASADLVRE